MEQQHYIRGVEERASREIDRVREESKGLTGQLKEANKRLLAAQQLLQSVHAELGEAREQRATAQAQVHVLRDQVELARVADKPCFCLQVGHAPRVALLAQARSKVARARAKSPCSPPVAH